MDWGWYLFATAFVSFASASFFFALAESALFALGKFRVKQITENETADPLASILRTPQDLLATLVLGNTFANSGLVGLGVWFVVHRNWPILLTLGAVLLLILILCEVLPKTLGVRAPEFWAGRVAPPARFLLSLTKPCREVAQNFNSWVLGKLVPASVAPTAGISDTEYQELLEMALQEGALQRSEKEIISQIIRLDQRTAREVMRPRSQITCISDELSREEMMEQARKSKHTRLPIYDETPDIIVGVLNSRALLLNPDLDLEDVIEFPSFVPESMNLLQLFKSLQRQQRGLAIVLDEFGSAAGLVTMEDILQELLGPFGQTRHPQGFRIENLAPGKWRVNGACSIEEFRREYPEIGAVEEVDTISGLVVQLFEYVPNRGESTFYKGLKFSAQKVDERRIEELIVERVKRP